MNKKIFGIIFLLALVLFSCGEEEEDNYATPYDDIEFGTSDFLKVGNKWVYSASSEYGGDSALIVEIVSAHPVYEDVFKVSNRYYNRDPYFSYWYIDGDYLKVYEQGEAVIDAHPIYRVKNIVAGEEWQGESENEYLFYKVDSLNVVQNCYLGSFVCNEITVEFSNAFNQQYNYWNDTIGLIKMQNDFITDYILSSINF